MAQQRLEAIEALRIEAERRLSELDANLERLAGLRAELSRLDDPAESGRLAHELDEARTRFMTGEEALRSLRQYVEDEAQALSLLKAQSDRLKSLEDCARRIAQNTHRLEDVDTRLAELNARSDTVRRDLAGKRKARDDSEESADTVDRRERALRQALTVSARPPGAPRWWTGWPVSANSTGHSSLSPPPCPRTP